MADSLKPDVCIIGAGGLGVALAIGARQRGLSTILVERDGGEPGDPLQASLHRAALAASAAQAQAIRTGSRLGLDNALPKLNYKAIAEHTETVAASRAPESSPERLTALGVTMLKGHFAFTDRNTLAVGEILLRPGHVILATGSTPMVPQLPGLNDVPFFTPDTILANVRKLTHLLVVGGDTTAVELAQIYRRLGSDVTLVSHGPLLDGFDREATAILRRHLREEGLAVLENARIKAFLPRSQGIGVSLDDPDDRIASLDISHVLVALGRVPQLDWSSLEKARLTRRSDDASHLLLNAQGRTSHFRITALGGAAGDANLHQALRKGEQLFDQLAGRRSLGGAAALPQLVGTQPALAQVGTAAAIDAPKQNQTILRANLSENDAARAVGLASGSAKIVVDRQGRILAGAMVGEGAGEVISSLALAMSKDFGAAELAQLPVVGTSALAILIELGAQFANQQPASNWSKRRASLRRLLP
jgi:pyruvate/2-oxoglutarate dehydrogenase complex dihydrolipoamide dehydrogenase (E3) component